MASLSLFALLVGDLSGKRNQKRQIRQKYLLISHDGFKTWFFCVRKVYGFRNGRPFRENSSLTQALPTLVLKNDEIRGPFAFFKRILEMLPVSTRSPLVNAVASSERADTYSTVLTRS